MNDNTVAHPHSAPKESPCSPTDVLNRLLALIAPDGSVRLCYAPDDPDASWETIPPHQPVPLHNLAEQVYVAHLIRIARLLFQLCQRINAQRLPDNHPSLRSAAVELTAYQHDPAFLHEALALITPDEQGHWTRPPQMPDDATVRRPRQ